MSQTSAESPDAAPTADGPTPVDDAATAGPAGPVAAVRNDAVLWAGGTLLAVTMAAFVGWSLPGERAAPAVGWSQAALAAAAVAGVCWGAWQRYRLWALPVRRLGEVVERVRRGELPIDELSRIDGVPGALVPTLRELLVDLRGRRAEVLRLEQEMTRRVASRTDALERQLGTVQEKAARDPLTGLHNRRMLDETLPKLVERARAARGSVTVLMIDVDHFKLLNDTLGHAAGDELLRSIGQVVRSATREGDYAFRCGGDEFVVVLDGADRTTGRALADRLVSLVDELCKPLRVGRRPRLSVGLAALHAVPDPTARGLLEAADKALYEVKGRRKRGVGVAVAPAAER